MLLADRTVWPYRYRRGASALIVSMPHVGTFIPGEVRRRLTDCAMRRPDTDWHLPRLHDFLGELDATVVSATYSRYYIDLNRPADGSNLYPGQDTPRLCPVDTFHKEPLYRDGREPDPGDIAKRLERVWHPYHRRLQAEIERVRGVHGHVLLWEAHSIFSEVPRLFAGRLPDLNLGTAEGAACGAGLGEALLDTARGHGAYTAVLNGRFKGGHITRTYGDPSRGVHAVQLEMAESTYMDEASPYTFRTERARRVRPVLRALLETALRHVNPRRASAV